MKAKLSLTYKLLFLTFIFLAILDRAGVFTQNLKLHTLYSFTTISNVCVMLVVLFSTFNYGKNTGVRFARLNYLCLVIILITGVIYHFILLPQKVAENSAYQVFTFGNIIAHYIAPVGTLADWLLFSKKGLLSKREPLICLAIPTLYFIIASLYGYYGSTIPGKETSYVYFFMDIEKLGVLGVIAWISVILAFVLLLDYSIYALDCVLGRRNNSKKQGNLINLFAKDK